MVVCHDQLVISLQTDIKHKECLFKFKFLHVFLKSLPQNMHVILKMKTYPFTVIVDLLVLVWTVGRTDIICSWFLRVHLGIDRVTDVVLLGVTSAMLPHPLLSPKHRLAAFILAVKVLCVLHITLLEATALILVKPQQILLPHILGDALRNLHERYWLSLVLTTIARAWW